MPRSAQVGPLNDQMGDPMGEGMVFPDRAPEMTSSGTAAILPVAPAATLPVSLRQLVAVVAQKPGSNAKTSENNFRQPIFTANTLPTDSVIEIRQQIYAFRQLDTRCFVKITK